MGQAAADGRDSLSAKQTDKQTIKVLREEVKVCREMIAILLHELGTTYNKMGEALGEEKRVWLPKDGPRE